MRGCAHALQWPSWSFTHRHPLWVKMTSSTKPEVRIILHCRQRRTEPWPQPRITCNENFVKFGHVVRICFSFLRYVSGQTDTQTHTDTLIALLRTPPGGEVNIDNNPAEFKTLSSAALEAEWENDVTEAGLRLHLRRVCTCICVH